MTRFVEQRPRIVLVCVATLLLVGQATRSAWAGEVAGYSGQYSEGIQIEVPSYRGLEPQIGVGYASGAGNGLAGVGAYVSGASVIQRAAAPSGGVPKYDANDVYLLDGSLLVANCTTYGGTYCKRVDTHERITYDAGANTWYVTDKLGRKSTYEAKFLTSKGTYRWYRTKVEQQASATVTHTVTYNYWCDGASPSTKDCYLDTVTYNGNTVQLFRASRETNEKLTFAYGTTTLGQTSYRIKTIGVQVGSTWARAYQLGYLPSAKTSKSQLATVTLVGKPSIDSAGTVSGGLAAPAMSFTFYAEPPGTFAAKQSTLVGGYSNEERDGIADVNGDGRDDWVYCGEDYVAVKLGQADGKFGTTIVTPGPSCGSSYNGNDNRVDVNGDGRTDMVMVYSSVIQVYLANANGSFQAVKTFTPPGSNIDRRMWGDINGDGRADFVYCGEGQLVAKLADASGNLGANLVTLGPGCGSSYDAYNRFLDVNGDGRADFVWTTESGIHVYLSNGDGYFQSTAVVTTPGPGGTYGRADFGDVNGDGLADYFYCGDGSVSVRLANGDGSFGALITTTGITCGDTYEERDNLIDVNGDGLADLTKAGNNSMLVYFSKGDGTFITTAVSTDNDGLNYEKRMWGDINGDGRTDWVYFGGGSSTLYTKLNNGDASGNPWLLKEHVNNLGGKTTITYRPSPTWFDVANSWKLPLGMVVQTVYQVTTSNGITSGEFATSGTVTYGYGQAKYLNPYESPATTDPVGEFAGFYWSTAAPSWAGGAFTKTYYRQDRGAGGQPTYGYRLTPAGANLTYDQFTYLADTAPPYVMPLVRHQEFECNGDASCRQKRRDWSYDAYGNTTRQDEYGDYSVSGDELTTTWAFVVNQTRYVASQPATVNKYAGIGTGGTLLGREKFFYDGAASETTAPTYGLLTKKSAWLSLTGGYVDWSYLYDTYGNTTKYTDENAKWVSKTYDTTYRQYVTKVTDAVGDTTAAWDYVLGKETTQTNLNLRTTTTAYDRLGRVTLVTAPDGAQSKTEYLSYGTPASQKNRVSVLMPGSVWVWDDQFFDGLGRTYKKVSQSGAIQETVYGAHGYVTKAYLAYVSGETRRYDEHFYDYLGRRTKLVHPDGTTVQHGYGDGTASITDPVGNQSTYFYDVYGRLTKVQQVIGTTSKYTSFYYDRLGRRTKSTDASGFVTTATYDSLGRIASKSDPDHGAWYSYYDNGGRLTKETDAAGKSSYIYYDAVGRATKRKYHDSTWDKFTFDETGRGDFKGRLTTVITGCTTASQTTCTLGTSSVTLKHYYDVAGRKTKFQQKVGTGTEYTISHTYDLAGRVAAVTYPDTEVVTYGYGTSSNLQLGKLVSVGNKVTNITYSAKGQIKSMTYGNGVTTTITHDAYGEKPASIAIGSLATLSYGYDAGGRVTAITSPQLHDWSYQYDSIGRLTRGECLDDQTKTQTFGYDAVGRMTYNSKVGSYTYGSKPHAVTSAGGVTYAYDPNGNMTSGAGRVLTYDLGGRVTKVTLAGKTISYVYDPDGNRVRQTNTVTTDYVGAIYEKRGATTVKYYTAGGLTVAKNSGGTVTYLHTDHLGSTRLVTSNTGAEVKRYEYAPFGEVVATTGTGGTEPRQFTGQELDENTGGLQWFQARYYDGHLGRFLQPDTILPDADDPQALDPYAYAKNSPTNGADPSGHIFESMMKSAAKLIHSAAKAGWDQLYSLTVKPMVSALTFIMANKWMATIFMISMAVACPYALGAMGMLASNLVVPYAIAGGVCALLQSPVSPLGPRTQQTIGWVYCVGTWCGGMGTAEADLYKWVMLGVGIGFGAASGVATKYGGERARYTVGVVGAILGNTKMPGGAVAAAGETYSLYYNFSHPDGRTYDMSHGSTDTVKVKVYSHAGFGSGFAFGRQHARIQFQHDTYELGDFKTGEQSWSWSGWVATRKTTVIMDKSEAKAMGRALDHKGKQGGTYTPFRADSYTYIDKALKAYTGMSLQDIHVNRGLIHLENAW